MLFNNTLTEITHTSANTCAFDVCIQTFMIATLLAEWEQSLRSGKVRQQQQQQAARNACFENIIALVNYRNWRSGGVAESRSASSLDKKKVGLDGNRYRFAQCTCLQQRRGLNWNKSRCMAVSGVIIQFAESWMRFRCLVWRCKTNRKNMIS